MFSNLQLVETPPPESVSPPLSAVFSLLPRVVEKLKESKDSTTLYLTYNRLMDALTIDEHFLRSQTTQSLVMAESSYQEATSLLVGLFVTLLLEPKDHFWKIKILWNKFPLPELMMFLRPRKTSTTR
jgi:hypothetical protein